MRRRGRRDVRSRNDLRSEMRYEKQNGHLKAHIGSHTKAQSSHMKSFEVIWKRMMSYESHLKAHTWSHSKAHILSHTKALSSHIICENIWYHMEAIWKLTYEVNNIRKLTHMKWYESSKLTHEVMYSSPVKSFEVIWKHEVMRSDLRRGQNDRRRDIRSDMRRAWSFDALTLLHLKKTIQKYWLPTWSNMKYLNILIWNHGKQRLNLSGS